MRGTVFPADAARNENDKLSCLGAFWSTAQAGPVLSDVVFVLRLDESELEIEYPLKLVLAYQTGDEAPVIEINAGIRVTRNDSDASGPAVVARGVSVGKIDLKQGSYAWILEVDGVVLDEWPLVVHPRAE